MPGAGRCTVLPWNLARNFVAQDLWQVACDGEQTDHVHSGLVAHGLQHVDGVLAADVAGRPRGIWAATQPAQRAIETRDALLNGRQNIGQPHSAGVVEVERELQVAEAAL